MLRMPHQLMDEISVLMLSSNAEAGGWFQSATALHFEKANDAISTSSRVGQGLDASSRVQ
jgi:hypothetical protein